MHIVLWRCMQRLGQPPINEIEAPSLYPLDIATALTAHNFTYHNFTCHNFREVFWVGRWVDFGGPGLATTFFPHKNRFRKLTFFRQRSAVWGAHIVEVLRTKSFGAQKSLNGPNFWELFPS